jgi:hypothetical protein
MIKKRKKKKRIIDGLKPRRTRTMMMGRDPAATTAKINNSVGK